MKHSFRIPNSYYVPQGSVRLLSLQNWAQTLLKNKKRGAKPACITHYDQIKPGWNNDENQFAMAIGKNNNVATFKMAPPGYNTFFNHFVIWQTLITKMKIGTQ